MRTERIINTMRSEDWCLVLGGPMSGRKEQSLRSECRLVSLSGDTFPDSGAAALGCHNKGQELGNE